MGVWQKCVIYFDPDILANRRAGAALHWLAMYRWAMALSDAGSRTPSRARGDQFGSRPLFLL